MLNQLRWILGFPIPVKITTEDDTEIPRYMHPGDSGMDVHAHLDESFRLQPRDRTLVPTGLRIAVPRGFEMQLRPRSGLALQGITIPNTPATIDPGFRGELHVPVINLDTLATLIQPGMRLAQMVLCPTAKCKWKSVEELPDSTRGAGGFGSTGT